MRVRNLMALLGVLLLTVLSFAGPASAYPAPDETTAVGTVSDTAVAPGEDVAFSGGGFAAGSTVDLAINGSSAGAATVSGSGEFAATLDVSDCGTNTLSATGEGADGERRVVTATVTVSCTDDSDEGTDTDDGAAGGSDSGDGVLPFTGSSAVMTSLIAGLVLVALGALFLVGGRRGRTVA